MTSLRIAFAGTPDFAAAHLQALIDSPHQIVAVLTQPDRPAGRGKKLLPSAVKVLAEQHQLPVHQPLNFKHEENWQQLREMDIDLLVVVAYGLLLPTAVLQWPRLGCINVHGSLLPRWRGAAPIQRAIWAGDAHSGVAIMQMDEGLDTGAVILTQRCDIDAVETSASLYQKLAALGPQALIEAVSQLAEGRAVAVQQPEDGVTYAQKLSKQEALLDWQDAAQLCRNVRAFNPWPMVWFNLNEQPVKVWQASVVADNQGRAAGTIIQADKHGIVVACAQQAIRLEVLQFAGKNPLSAAEVLNGRAEFFSVGTTL